MSVDSLVFWLFVLAWVVVVGLLLFVQLPRIVTELRRIVTHIVALVTSSALPLLLVKAEADAGRIEASLDRFPALLGRAQAAVEAVRTTPIVPPTLVAFGQRVRREIAAFRQAIR